MALIATTTATDMTGAVQTGYTEAIVELFNFIVNIAPVLIPIFIFIGVVFWVVKRVGL